MVKSTSTISKPLRSRSADAKAIVRQARERLQPIVLRELGLRDENVWITQQRLLQGGAWAHAHRDELVAAFPSYAVSKLVRGDVRTLKDALVFARQFIRHACGGKLLWRPARSKKREYAWTSTPHVQSNPQSETLRSM